MFNYPLKELILHTNRNITKKDLDYIIINLNNSLTNTNWYAEYNNCNIKYRRFLTFRNKLNTNKKYNFDISSLQHTDSYINIDNNDYIFKLNDNPISRKGVRITIYNNINEDFDILFNILAVCLKNADMDIEYIDKNSEDTYKSLIGYEKAFDGNYSWIF